MNKLIRIIGLAIVGLFSTLLVANSVFANEVNVFSARHYDSDVQLYEKFTAKTGIKVNVVSGKDKALQKRIKEEGKDSKADIYITADAGRLGAFQAEGMFQKGASSAALKKVVPANFRSPYWVGIAKRARIIYYNPKTVNPSWNMSYEDLADPKYKGRVVIRKSSNIYNQSLVASLIKNNGENSYSRGGSDRSFLEFIQILGNEFGIKNKIIFVDSSSGEVERPSTKKTGLIGISDVHDNLKFDIVFKNGPKEYIRWFIELASKRSNFKINS